MKKPKLLSTRQRETWYKYKTPGQSALTSRRKVNQFNFGSGGLEHELAKLRLCYELKSSGSPFITEAERNKKDENGKSRIPDVVDLTTGIEWEFETDMNRGKRFLNQKNVTIVPVGWSFEDKKWKKITKE